MARRAVAHRSGWRLRRLRVRMSGRSGAGGVVSRRRARRVSTIIGRGACRRAARRLTRRIVFCHWAHVTEFHGEAFLQETGARARCAAELRPGASSAWRASAQPRALGAARGDWGERVVLRAVRGLRQPLPADGGGQRDGGQRQPGAGGGALAQLGIDLVPACSPQARGRSERMFGALRRRLPQELRLSGATDVAAANRFLRDAFASAHSARFASAAEGSAFAPYVGALEGMLCVQEDRAAGNVGAASCKHPALATPPDRHRSLYVKSQVRAREFPDGTLAVFVGPRSPGTARTEGASIPSARRPCNPVDSDSYRQATRDGGARRVQMPVPRTHGASARTGGRRGRLATGNFGFEKLPRSPEKLTGIAIRP